MDVELIYQCWELDKSTVNASATFVVETTDKKRAAAFLKGNEMPYSRWVHVLVGTAKTPEELGALCL